MTALNKQALREAANAANIASWGKWESYKPHKGARGYEVKVGAKAAAQHCLKVDAAFIATANPQTVLALLDELEASQKSNEFLKEQLSQLANFNPDWDKLEAATDSLREHMAKLSAAENRIAELEARTVKLPTGTEINGFQMLIESEVIALLREAGINVTVVRAAGIGVKGE